MNKKFIIQTLKSCGAGIIVLEVIAHYSLHTDLERVLFLLMLNFLYGIVYNKIKL